ncbi:MAG: SDR family oxidoreductase [Spirochaetes bacterium]|nr:SDR family oxidoreductase [Spirochaetota bacterium]
MEIRFDGKVALVTGASTGIGAATAIAFAEAGAKVAIHYNSSESEAHSVEKAVKEKGGEAFLVKADVTNAAETEKMVAALIGKFGRVDILVNNAGGLLPRHSVEEMPDDLFARVMDLNMTSTFRICKLLIPFMKKTGGTIINMSSIAARTGGAGGAVLYASSKAAVSTFTRGLAKELAPFNIRVNAIAPGIVFTPFHDKFTPADQLKGMVGAIPLGRGAQPHEIAGPALFLASEALAGFITGEVLEVNGGQLMA